MKVKISLRGYDIFIREKKQWSKVESISPDKYQGARKEYGRSAKFLPRFNRTGGKKK